MCDMEERLVIINYT